MSPSTQVVAKDWSSFPINGLPEDLLEKVCQLGDQSRDGRLVCRTWNRVLKKSILELSIPNYYRELNPKWVGSLTSFTQLTRLKLASPLGLNSSAIGALTKLQSLTLTFSDINSYKSDRFDTTTLLRSVKNIVHLEIGKFYFKLSELRAVSRLRNLTTLALNVRYVVCTNRPILHRLTGLERLKILVGEPYSMRHLSALKTIRSLTLHPSCCNWSQIENLSALSQLRRLEITNLLEHSHYQGESFSKWLLANRALPVTQLTLKRLRVCEGALMAIARFGQLRQLQILNSEIECKIAPVLNGFKCVHHLDLSKTKGTANIVYQLHRFYSLKHVNLTHCSFPISGETIEYFRNFTKSRPECRFTCEAWLQNLFNLPV